jgi:hypothetical protein
MSTVTSITIENLIAWSGETANIPANRPRDELTIIPVRQAMREEHNVEFEDKCIVGQLISLKHYSQTKSYIVSGGKNYGPGSFGNLNQRQRIVSRLDNMPYDRLAMFADLVDSKDGRCFAVCFTHVSSGEKFFKNLPSNADPCIGCIFVIEEPQLVKNYLGSNDSVPIVESWNRVVPISVPVSKCLSVVRMERSEAGHTNYFSANGDVELKFLGAAVVHACCNGTFCDRQLSSDQEGTRCGCFHISSEYKKGTGKVLQFNIRISVSKSIDERGYLVVEQFRSYRFSSLFVERTAWEKLEVGNMSHQKKLRSCVDSITKYINENGGFSYIGWKRVGTSRDASDVNNTNVASDTQVPHVSYLFPTNERLFLDAASRELMLTSEKLSGVQA